MSLDLYRRIYDEEWRRRDAIQASITLPITLVSVLGGALFVFARSFSFAVDPLTFWFTVPFTVAAVACAVTIYFLVRTSFGYLYRRIPWPDDIRRHHNALHSFHESQGDPPGLAERAFDDFLIARLVDAAERNARNNVDSGQYLYRAHQALIVTLVAIILTALPYLIDQRRQAVASPVTVQQVDKR
jgi:hypothetical protein